MRRNTLNVTLATVLIAVLAISLQAPASDLAFRVFAAAWSIAIVANNWPRPQRIRRTKTTAL
jgi:hypothetical protein